MNATKRFGPVAFLGALALAAPAALAQGHESGSDGCGLGWQFTQKKSMTATTTRATSTPTMPLGMTSGTLGCDRHSIVANDRDAAGFVLDNMDALRLEAAAGRGPRLAALSEVMGCADAGAFAATLKDSWAQVFPVAGIPGVEAFKNIRGAVGAGC